MKADHVMSFPVLLWSARDMPELFVVFNTQKTRPPQPISNTMPCVALVKMPSMQLLLARKLLIAMAPYFPSCTPRPKTHETFTLHSHKSRSSVRVSTSYTSISYPMLTLLFTTSACILLSGSLKITTLSTLSTTMSYKICWWLVNQASNFPPTGQSHKIFMHHFWSARTILLSCFGIILAYCIMWQMLGHLPITLHFSCGQFIWNTRGRCFLFSSMSLKFLRYVLISVLEKYKKTTVFFSQDGASVAAVIPAMDKIDNHLNSTTKKPYHPAIQAAMKLTCKKLIQWQIFLWHTGLQWVTKFDSFLICLLILSSVFHPLILPMTTTMTSLPSWKFQWPITLDLGLASWRKTSWEHQGTPQVVGANHHIYPNLHCMALDSQHPW